MLRSFKKKYMQRYKLMTFLPTQDKKGRGKKPVATPKAALHCCCTRSEGQLRQKQNQTS